MGGNETLFLYSEILRVYRTIDRKCGHIRRIASISCPKGCGLCCKTQKIEATILETLPLAEAIFEKKEEEAVLSKVENLIERNDFSCVLFLQDAEFPENGSCTYYHFRPLLCRLFGLAARRNRRGDLEFCTCRKIKENYPEAVRRAGIGVSAGMNIPVYQESFMQIAALNPGIGFKRLPINLAIKEALEYIYWRRPKRFKMAKAS